MEEKKDAGFWSSLLGIIFVVTIFAIVGNIGASHQAEVEKRKAAAEISAPTP